ncbi:hypothetical protein Pse7367_3464 [Thalassoporum mexicanum PCC 7367]|uniref:hypothetical protein n=1 Tax=Thalassoporum mexicanum TaxID=3457544 RepID=UPI00029FDAF7|nr:hypothetical protein [Pseudanabaena sp. PCC 7367]AFY71700.1 hypothetical protein Pse7367_3464 [Pseudanabaena sp. PCC 7367]
MDLPLLIGALIVAALLFLALINIIKVAIKTAFTIAIVVFVLQVLTGIGPEELATQVGKIIGAAMGWVIDFFGGDGSEEAIEGEAMLWLFNYLGYLH